MTHPHPNLPLDSEKLLAGHPGEGANARSAFYSLPGSWYDLTARIGEARAVASCVLECLPNGLEGHAYERMNHAGNLTAAVQDLLMLMEKDAELIATQLKL